MGSTNFTPPPPWKIIWKKIWNCFWNCFWNFYFENYLKIIFEIVLGFFFWIFFNENAERTGATSKFKKISVCLKNSFDMCTSNFIIQH
jgi:hypothetical protein